VDDSVVEDDVWKNNLSGVSSSGSDENSGSVCSDVDLVVVISVDAQGSSWESSREDGKWAADSVVEEEFRELELVECGNVCNVVCQCRVDWDEDGDWVGGREGGLSLHANVVCIVVVEGGKVCGHLGESGGESCECWVEDLVDNENLSVGDVGACVDWVSVNSDDAVVWGGVVVDTE